MQSQQKGDDPPDSDEDEMDVDGSRKAKEEELATVVPILVDGNAIDGGPPLGYARAVCRPSKRPERRFCEICGYWGNYRCGKCGARYCDLSCMGVHLETACNKIYR